MSQTLVVHSVGQLPRLPVRTAVGSAATSGLGYVRRLVPGSPPVSYAKLTAAVAVRQLLGQSRLASSVVHRPELSRSASSLATPSSSPASASASSSSSPPGSTTVYKTKKVWPPDFSRLSPQEQLRFEKRFKRRVALASARPRWTKLVKLVQLVSVTVVTIYCVLFMKWDYGPQPFVKVRAWFWDTVGMLKGGQRSAVQRPADGAAEAAQPATPSR